jgi:prepilin-type N-terminal cleavage/methylation domain-containing protein
MKNTIKQINRIIKTYTGKCKGFTLIEILTVVFLIGIIALPFTNMFMFGVRGSTNNAEHVVAYNLAREKIEEIKGLPFEAVKSDYKNFRDVFLDRPKYDDAYYNEDNFVSYFSDVFTESSLKKSENATSYKKLKELYPKAYLKSLDLYPNDYDSLRRVTMVEEISESALPPKLKKIIVMVYNSKNQKIAELRSYVGKHK